MWIRGHTFEASFVPEWTSPFLFQLTDRTSYRPACSVRVWPFLLSYSGPVRPEKRRS